MSNKVTLREIIDYLKKLTLPTVSGYFMASGMFLILTAAPGTLEHITAMVSIMAGYDTELPQTEFGWLPALGLVMLATGSLIKLKHYYTSLDKELREKRTKLKENYVNLTDARLEDEFEQLWFIKGASARAIRHLFGHPYSKNAVLNLFEKCHLNVVANSEWFEFKGRFLKIRFQIGYPVSILSFVLMFAMGLILGAAEYLQPGSTSSGPHAFYGYCAYCIFSILGAALVHKEFQALGHAITLVEEHTPSPTNPQE